MSGVSGNPAVPAWQILYGGKDITTALGPQVEMKYEESTGKRACSVEILFPDPQAVMVNGPPVAGTSLTVSLGYQGGVLTPCGTFQLDEYGYKIKPRKFSIKAIEAGMTQALRTNNSVSYEGQTLVQIAATVAQKHGFTVVSDAVNPNVPYGYISQTMERDLDFLHRIANMHNYDFNVRNNQLIFYSRPTLESATPSGTIYEVGCIEGDFKARTISKQTYSGCDVSYFDPQTKELITGSATDPNVPTADTLKATERVENAQQAQLRAQSYLHEHNMNRITGDIILPGTMAFRAGNNVNISGFGVFDSSTYQVKKAAHSLDVNAWVTRINLSVLVGGTSTQSVGRDITEDIAPPGVTPGT